MEQKFQDGDLAKVQSGQVQPKVVEHADMFEPTSITGEQSLEEILNGVDQAAGVDEGAQPMDGAMPVGEEIPGEEAPTDVPEDATAIAEEGAEDGEEVPGDVEDPVMKDLLDKIDAASQSAEEAQGNLGTAIEGGDSQQIQQAYQDFTVALAEKDRQIEILTKQVENEKGQADRFLNEKFVAESDGREKGKIFDAVMENPVLKDIVVYSMNAADNPQYQERLKDATKKLYEETHGVSVDEILNQNRVSEKQGLGDGSFQSDGVSNPDSGGLLGGMFEQLPD